jgi:[ribosomal protein S5]-alanine N-acetyltransferase
MKEQPVLTTERLILRPYSLSDAKELQRLIGDRDVSDTLLLVPYPYLDGMAEEWIDKQSSEYQEGKFVQFAISARNVGVLMGTIGLNNIIHEYQRAELGYWVGKPFWGKGYCTEAAWVVVRWGFEAIGLNRISATHMTRNPRSGRVMDKIGMKHEGHMRQYGKKWDKYEDGEMWAILRSDYTNQAL